MPHPTPKLNTVLSQIITFFLTAIHFSQRRVILFFYLTSSAEFQSTYRVSLARRTVAPSVATIYYLGLYLSKHGGEGGGGGYPCPAFRFHLLAGQGQLELIMIGYTGKGGGVGEFTQNGG